jgi:hypothetical protein
MKCSKLAVIFTVVAFAQQPVNLSVDSESSVTTTLTADEQKVWTADFPPATETSLTQALAAGTVNLQTLKFLFHRGYTHGQADYAMRIMGQTKKLLEEVPTEVPAQPEEPQ